MTGKLLLVLLGWSMIGQSQNLILNPDAELPLVAGQIPAWVETVGTNWTYHSTNPSPQSGQNYFFAGSGPEAELTQLVNVADFSCSIDFGIQTFQFTGFVRSFLQTPPDQSQIILELLNSQDVVLNTYDSGPNASTTAWTPVSKLITAPSGTRKIRIRLQSHRQNGDDNDGYFDNLSLVPMPTDRNIVISGITALPTSCGAKDGSLAIRTIGGTGRIFYSLDGINFQNSNTYEGLAGGVYTVTVKDQSNAGCTVTQSTTLLGGSTPVIQTITSLSASCGQANGSLSVSATGSGPLQYSLDGLTYQTSNQFEGLAGGTYPVTVKELAPSGCTILQRATVPGVSGPIVQPVVPTSATCGQPNGSITVIATGGTGTLLYSIDGVNFQTINKYTGLKGGVYTISVRDGSAAGCTPTQQVTVLSGSGPSILTMATTVASCGRADGTVSISAVGGSGMLRYSLDGVTFQVSNAYSNLTDSIYTLTVQDQAGCQVLGEFTIPSGCQVYIPDAFSPNDDGLNDYFRIISGSGINYTINQYLIYNRWGEVIFSSRNFSMLETGTPWWNGLINDQRAPAGTYSYYVDYTGSNQRSRKLRGQLMLIR